MEINWSDIRDIGLSIKLSPERIFAIKKYQNRFNIPQGLTKKELKVLLKETQDKINDCLKRMRELGPDNNILADIEREDYVLKKAKINKILKLHDNFGTQSISKAKEYPIEQLIEFNNAGFAKCIDHDERTPSLKFYPRRNKAHCFSCSGDFDSIDIYQKLNNVDFSTAVKALS